MFGKKSVLTKKAKNVKNLLHLLGNFPYRTLIRYAKVPVLILCQIESVSIDQWNAKWASRKRHYKKMTETWLFSTCKAQKLQHIKNDQKLRLCPSRYQCTNSLHTFTKNSTIVQVLPYFVEPQWSGFWRLFWQVHHVGLGKFTREDPNQWAFKPLISGSQFGVCKE